MDREGFIDLDSLENMLDDTSPRRIHYGREQRSWDHSKHSAISGILGCRGILFHCDAAQAPCAMDMGNLAAHADLISLSGHKMYGPQGIGGLYIRRALQPDIEPIIYGGGQQNGLRSGTLPLPLCVGMAAAVDLLRTTEGAKERSRISEQRDLFVRLLRNGGIPVALNGPAAQWRHPGNANLRFSGFPAEDILGSVQPQLAASTGAACSSGIPEPSHVLRAMGLSNAEAGSSIRFSFGRFTPITRWKKLPDCSSAASNQPRKALSRPPLSGPKPKPR